MIQSLGMKWMSFANLICFTHTLLSAGSAPTVMGFLTPIKYIPYKQASLQLDVNDAQEAVNWNIIKFNCRQLDTANICVRGDARSSSTIMSSSTSDTTDQVLNSSQIRPSRALTQRDGRIMTFLGKKNVSATSSSLQNDDNILLSAIYEYFLQDSNRNILFSQQNVSKQKGPLTLEQLTLWVQESELGGGVPPTFERTTGGRFILINNQLERHDIIKIETSLYLNGLKVLSESTIGVKLILPRESGQKYSPTTLSSENNCGMLYPEYQFTLLDSNLQPTGPRALIWLFQQITKFRDKTSSFTRVYVRPHPTTTENVSLVFTTEARLQIMVRIPSRMNRILPQTFDVSRFERQGTEAVQRLLEKELEPALRSFCVQFYDFYNKQENV